MGLAGPPRSPPFHTIHSPTPLSHIGTSPPSAYPQITSPIPRRGLKTRARCTLWRFPQPEFRLSVLPPGIRIEYTRCCGSRLT